MSLKEKLKKLVEKEINKSASAKLFESKEELEAMDDSELIRMAEQAGIDEIIVKDGSGKLTDESRNEVIQSLCNLENSADDIEEEAELDKAEGKISPFDAHEFLKDNNMLGKDFFVLRSEEVDKLLDYAKQVKYRKSRSAPGSTARMFFYYLDRLANRWTKNHDDVNEQEIDELSNKTLGSYVKKASDRAVARATVGGVNVGLGKPDENNNLKYSNKRLRGIGKAVDKMTKNSMNEAAGDYDDKFYVWDDGGAESASGSMDRYTILLKDDISNVDRNGQIPVLISGVDPRGMSGHESVFATDIEELLDAPELEFKKDTFLGDQIPFSSLPDAVQQFAINDYADQLNDTVDEAVDDENDKDEDDKQDDEFQDEDPEAEDKTETEEDEEELEGEAEPEKITVVVISPELKKNDDDDDDNQDSYDLDNKNLINTNEHVEALFSGETLSEQFKEKAKVVFEAALAEHTKALRNKFVQEFRIRESKIQKKFNAQVQEVKESLIKEQAKVVDGYLSEAVDTWVAENQMVLESNIRTELTEEFIDGLKNLFTESYIEVPAEKFDLIKAQEIKIKELEESLATEKKGSRKNLKEAKRLHCESVINKQTSDMTEVEKAKFLKLVESIDFDSIDQFERKVKTLKESYMKKTSVKENTINERKNKVVTQVTLEENVSSSPIDQVSAALGTVFLANR